jgi:hypothetical protein
MIEHTMSEPVDSQIPGGPPLLYPDHGATMLLPPSLYLMSGRE